MNAERLVEILLDLDRPAFEVLVHEASVHLPRRGTRWVAAFRDEHGQPVWRTTGLSDRTAAQALADEWEAEARRKRAALGIQPKKPTVRVRAGSPEHQAGLRSQQEVAIILRLSTRAVRAIERRAIQKLRNHPALQEFWREWTGEMEEAASYAAGQWDLSQSEIAALYGLAKSPAELEVLRKLIALIQASAE
jgi:hypothetical protein